MTISLTSDLENIVAEKMRSGQYGSASDVIREGLRLLMERDERRQSALEALRAEIAVGIDQADRGDVFPWDVDAIKAQGRAILDDRGRR